MRNLVKTTMASAFALGMLAGGLNLAQAADSNSGGGSSDGGLKQNGIMEPKNPGTNDANNSTDPVTGSTMDGTSGETTGSVNSNSDNTSGNLNTNCNAQSGGVSTDCTVSPTNDSSKSTTN